MADRNAFGRGGGGRRSGGRGGRQGPYDWKDRSRPWKDRRQGPRKDGSPSGGPRGAQEELNHSHGSEGGEATQSHGVSGASQASSEARRIIKKFSNKARLFVGNLPRDFSEEELKKLFEPHGEVQEVYVHKEKNFGFVRMAYRGDAEKAIAANHGLEIRTREIKVRFAASSCSVKVTNLHPLVSNELLEEAFSQFGEVENAVVVTDERGKSLGYGIVDFARKAQAIASIQRCKNEPFLLTRSPIPVMVRELVRDNEDEGQPEKSIPRTAQYMFEREYPPRFAQVGTMEYEAAARWRMFFELEESEKEAMDQKLRAARSHLEQEMVQIKEQHETVLLRQEILRHHQEQVRLAEKLRQQEERLQIASGGTMTSGYYAQQGQAPAPLFPTAQPEGDAGMESNEQKLMAARLDQTTAFPGGVLGAGPGPGAQFQIPQTSQGQGVGQFVPPPLMGQGSKVT